jgi:hypothetical protein
VRELVERYGARPLRYYGVDFFKDYRGVTAATLDHLIDGEGIRGRAIIGCRDRTRFSPSSGPTG